MMQLFRYLRSFISEELVERIDSKINVDLTVGYGNGRYLLNSKDLNYAFGSLHKAFQDEFRRLNIKDIDFKNVLILGFGVGSIASIIQEEYEKECAITGIEIDPEVLRYGEKYFNTERFKNVRVFCKNAVEFLAVNTEKYDLVIVDVYIGNDVPACCETEQFLYDLKKSMTNEGLMVFNKYIYDEQSQNSADLLLYKIRKIFRKVTLHVNNGYMLSGYC